MKKIIFILVLLISSNLYSNDLRKDINIEHIQTNKKPVMGKDESRRVGTNMFFLHWCNFTDYSLKNIEIIKKYSPADWNRVRRGIQEPTNYPGGCDPNGEFSMVPDIMERVDKYMAEFSKKLNIKLKPKNNISEKFEAKVLDNVLYLSCKVYDSFNNQGNTNVSNLRFEIDIQNQTMNIVSGVFDNELIPTDISLEIYEIGNNGLQAKGQKDFGDGEIFTIQSLYDIKMNDIVTMISAIDSNNHVISAKCPEGTANKFLSLLNQSQKTKEENIIDAEEKSNSNDSFEEQLIKLKSLYDKKLITKDEYDKERQEVLDEM